MVDNRKTVVEKIQLLPDILKRHEHGDAVDLLRDAFDELDESGLRELLSSPAVRVDSEDVDGLMAVAWADTVAHSWFNLAAMLWRKVGEEREAVEVMRSAVVLGADNALFTLADWLHWLEQDEEAERILRALLGDDRSLQPAESGLLGLVLAEGLNRFDDETISLLRAGKDEDGVALALASVLSRTGDDKSAVEILQMLAARGDATAAVRLGNILGNNLGDFEAAERAYRRGMELGDPFSAYNLALDLADQGRDTEARDLLEWAAERGDAKAAKALEAYAT